MKNQTIIIIILVCVSVASIWFFGHNTNVHEHPQQEAIYSIPRRIQYSFTLQNKTNLLIKNAEFWVYAPVNQTSTQRCDNIETSHPNELIVDSLGNQILYFTFDVVPPNGTKIITVKANLMLSNEPNPIETGDLQTYLAPGKYIESDEHEIIKMAETFKTPETLETAGKIFKWVANNVKYAGYIENDRGALYALRHKKGDCTEFMYLFAAFCRANQIPARCIAGYICPENSILKPGGYHNWAEIYEGDAWKNVDPQNKVFMENSSHYIAMRVIGDTKGNPMGEYNRFRFEGDGLKVKMNK